MILAPNHSVDRTGVRAVDWALKASAFPSRGLPVAHAER